MAIRLYVRMVTSFSFSPYHHKAFAPVLLVLLLLILRPNVWILIKTAGPNRYSSCHKLLLFLLFIPYFFLLSVHSFVSFLSLSFLSQFKCIRQVQFYELKIFMRCYIEIRPKNKKTPTTINHIFDKYSKTFFVKLRCVFVALSQY